MNTSRSLHDLIQVSWLTMHTPNYLCSLIHVFYIRQDMVRARRQRERNSEDSDGDGEFAGLDPHSMVAKTNKKKKKKQNSTRSNKQTLTFESQLEREIKRIRIERIQQQKRPEPPCVWNCRIVVCMSVFVISALYVFFLFFYALLDSIM